MFVYPSRILVSIEPLRSNSFNPIVPMRRLLTNRELRILLNEMLQKPSSTLIAASTLHLAAPYDIDVLTLRAMYHMDRDSNRPTNCCAKMRYDSE